MKETERRLEEVKSDKRPTTEESRKVANVAKEFVANLETALKAAKLKAAPVVGGSGAKGTWLKGMHDIDIFVCFDYARYKEKSRELSEFLAVAVKKTFPRHERLHGSRDYFKVSYNGYNFEVIPILKIARANQARNITDASLLHAVWVTKEARKKPGLADEIRLAKAFCKAQRVYGAESYVRGFSGYACEVLTIYYGGFLKLATAAASKWKKQIAAGKKIVVDAAGHYKGRDPTRELNEAKVQSELIVIDPIQKDRNATAALSSEVLWKFITATECLLKNPAKSQFERQDVTAETLAKKARGKSLIIIEAKPLPGKEDVVGAKLMKVFGHFLKALEENGFKTSKSGWEWNGKKAGDAMLWYALDKKVPEAEIREGPPLDKTIHADSFRKEHSEKKGSPVFERNGRLYARIERAYSKPQQLVKTMIAEDEYLKDKAKSYWLK
ncbi:TPA: CCA tRNA nucleotidyltransferase [Candidatus Woesearchaeota archaeon]|nr:CCA tRNA nucleotidyltransferase [Candidatus Woesearchaeota archaeon]